MEPSTMDDERTNSPTEPPTARNGIRDDTSQSQVYHHRINHATTATVANDRYITIYTLEIHTARDDSTIVTHMVHYRIFDAIKVIDDTAAILSLDQSRIGHGKYILEGDDYKKVFMD